MHENYPAAEMHRFSSHAMFRLIAMQVVCLSAVGLIAIGALIASLFELPQRGVTAAWMGMTLDPVIAALGCCASLAFSIARPSKSRLAASRVLACAAAIPAFLILLSRFRGSANDLEALIRGSAGPAPMPGVVAFAFVLLAVVLCFIRTRRGIGSYAADFLVFVLGFLVLSMISGWLFMALRVFDMPDGYRTPPAALCILALLIPVTFSVRAQYGAFDILVESGIGSRIARRLTPVILAL